VRGSGRKVIWEGSLRLRTLLELSGLRWLSSLLMKLPWLCWVPRDLDLQYSCLIVILRRRLIFCPGVGEVMISSPGTAGSLNLPRPLFSARGHWDWKQKGEIAFRGYTNDSILLMLCGEDIGIVQGRLAFLWSCRISVQMRAPPPHWLQPAPTKYADVQCYHWTLLPSTCPLCFKTVEKGCI